MKIEEECIFAVAYDIIKTTYKLDVTARKFVTNLLDVGPMRASAKHMAFRMTVKRRTMRILALRMKTLKLSQGSKRAEG
jgi:hypothetical protein